MAKLILRANIGSKERPSIRETTLENEMLSQKYIAYLFSIDPEELDTIAKERNINQDVQFKGDDRKKAIFYDIAQIPDLLLGLKQKCLAENNRDKDWFTSVDMTRDTFQFILPSGSVITFSTN